MGRIDWMETQEPCLESQLCVEDIIKYLRIKADTASVINLKPEEAGDLVRYIDQIRAINQTFAIELMTND